MTETEENRVNVTMYRDVQVQVNERGRFFATPQNARKEREAANFYEITKAIDKYLDEAKARKRKPCRVAFHYWNDNEGKVLSAEYLGTRGRDTDTHRMGHACVDQNGRNFTLDRYNRRLRLLSDEHVVDGKTVLEHRYAEYTKAKAALAEAVKEWTEEVEAAYLCYAPNAEELDKSQREMIVQLKLVNTGEEG